MALNKAVEFNGIVLDYHKIIQIEENYKTNVSVVTMASYVSKAARANNIHGHFQVYIFNFLTLDLARSDAYSLIKLQNGWSDAIND